MIFAKYSASLSTVLATPNLKSVFHAAFAASQETTATLLSNKLTKHFTLQKNKAEITFNYILKGIKTSISTLTSTQHLYDIHTRLYNIHTVINPVYKAAVTQTMFLPLLFSIPVDSLFSFRQTKLNNSLRQRIPYGFHSCFARPKLKFIGHP